MIISDNGTTVSAEFQKFLRKNGIRYKLTAPYNPSTNGQAERFVQTLKNSLKSINTKNFRRSVTTYTYVILYYTV